MKRLIYTFVMISLFLSCQSPVSTDTDCEGYSLQNYTYSAEEIELMELVNEYRIQNNLSQVSPLNHIGAVCYEHTQWMINTSMFNHDGFSKRFDNLECILGATYRGECIGYNYQTPESMLNGLLASEDHYQIIIMPANKVGVSILTNSENQKIFTLILIKN